MKKKTDYRWIIKIVIWSMILSVAFTLASTEIIGNAGYLLAFVILLMFIALGVLFDIIGVSVTSATEKPFHSMASHRENGAVEAIWLLKNAEKVASFCNDVVGDISGIVSGGAAAIIAARIAVDFQNGNGIVLQLSISALVAGLTIGGKALGKSLAINKSTDIVLIAAKIIYTKNCIIKKGQKVK